MYKIFKAIDGAIDKTSIWLLVTSLGLMLFFSVLSIVLRWFNTSLPWIEPFVRHLVFFATFLGGILATGRGSHIGIDMTTKLMEAKGWHFMVKNVGRVIALASFATLIWLSYASLEFVYVEKEFGKEAFWGIHSGDLVAIIPGGFFVIAICYLLNFILSLFPQHKEVSPATAN